ncbi:MAG TPA: DNA repair protein RecN [Bacteroidales bacterium]|nr:DNA repair protein RecN [Bacteroidales bacterium]
MLCNLVVENYALISKLEIEFMRGLTIITGETGAGKSILLGALSLILGKRADSGVLYDKGKKCIVEGTFDVSRYDLKYFFTGHEIDYEDQTIIRREISSAGKSRAFINDIPVTLEVLGELAAKLIDIHSQHQHLNLADSLFQMNVLDSYAQAQDLLSEYLFHFHEYQNLNKRFRELSDIAGRTKSELDYLEFQFRQLEEAHLTEGEQDELELELEKLMHAEDIKTGLSGITTLLQGDNMPVLQQLKDCLGLITRISKYLPEGENLKERIETGYIELKDIAQALDNMNNQLYLDPARLTQVNDRLTLLYSLEKKHGLDSVGELIALRNKISDNILEINNYDNTLGDLQKEQEQKRLVLNDYSSRLSVLRKKSLVPFADKVSGMLREVGIPNADFRVEHIKLEEFSDHGTDKFRFLFSANKNAPPQDISRVASGGELSRLMLCIKSLMSDSEGFPTIIFDEIDTGVSGEIAERVGNIIIRMSERMQVINITHLPQVASKGKQHYLVYKTDEDKSTVTRMKLLSPEERHIEIARMLSGEEITSAALENARALLGN